MAETEKKSKKGFTLTEALLAAVVLSMAITGIVMPFTAGAQNEQNDARGTLAVALGQEMMEEILAKPFRDPQGSSGPGPEPGENTRNRFDNIDDYDGYSEFDGELVGFNGTAIDGPAAVGLSRHVTAAYVYVAGQDTSGDATFIRIKVEVKYRNQPVVTLTRLVYEIDSE